MYDFNNLTAFRSISNSSWRASIQRHAEMHARTVHYKTRHRAQCTQYSAGTYPFHVVVADLLPLDLIVLGCLLSERTDHVARLSLLNGERNAGVAL